MNGGQDDGSLYIVVAVGCIECGESGSILGTFDSHEKAKQAMTGWNSNADDPDTLIEMASKGRVEIHKVSRP